ERVIARRRVRIEDLVLEDREAPLPDGDEVARVLAAAALAQFDSARPANDSSTGRFLIRLRCLREWMPELNLPTFADADIRTLLVDLCSGRKSLVELRSADWLSAIHGRLTYAQLQTIEREA